MKRKELQAMCKKHGLPANLKKIEMAYSLTSLLEDGKVFSFSFSYFFLFVSEIIIQHGFFGRNFFLFFLVGTYEFGSKYMQNMYEDTTDKKAQMVEAVLVQKELAAYVSHSHYLLN